MSEHVRQQRYDLGKFNNNPHKPTSEGKFWGVPRDIKIRSPREREDCVPFDSFYFATQVFIKY